MYLDLKKKKFIYKFFWDSYKVDIMDICRSNI